MILNRMGNKRKMSQKIIPYFPRHTLYIEPFFGAGGMFFSKPKVIYNIMNDLDSDVFNLFQVLQNQKEELYTAVYEMPIHSDLLAFWQKNKEDEPIKKAARFLLLSNFTYLGIGGTLKLGMHNQKQLALSLIDRTNALISDVLFSNKDFEGFINSIAFRHKEDKKNAFIYCDPPYVGTADNYENSFKEADFLRLLQCLIAKGTKFAVSEFDSGFVTDTAKSKGLNITILGERQNLKNRRAEILITNYQNNNTLF